MIDPQNKPNLTERIFMLNLILLDILIIENTIFEPIILPSEVVEIRVHDVLYWISYIYMMYCTGYHTFT